MEQVLNGVDNEDFKAIEQALDMSLEYGLEIEVIYWALKAMKEDSSLSPGQAMFIGIAEWVK